MATTVLNLKQHYPFVALAALALVAVIAGDRLPVKAIMGFLALIGIGYELVLIWKIKKQDRHQ